MKRMAVLVLVCCLLLTGCSSVDSTADILADGIAGQVESMYVDGRQTTSTSTPDRDSALAPTVSAVDLADQARREYEALKMQNWGTPMGQALISDLDGNGIPELILVTNQILDIQDNDGSVEIKDVDLLPTWVYRYQDNDGSKYYILPLDDVANIEKTTGISDIQQEAQDSYDRTMEELGPGLEKAKQIFGGSSVSTATADNKISNTGTGSSLMNLGVE